MIGKSQNCLFLGKAFGLCFLLGACVAKNETTKLKVFVHEPFISSVSYEFDERIRYFEEKHQCKIEWVSYGGSPVSLLERMKNDLTFEIDLLYGVDNTNLLDFKQSQLFLPYESQDLSNILEELKLDKDCFFTPINYGWLAFEYSNQTWKDELPGDLKNLVEKPFKDNYILINPRSNAVGLLFTLWLDACHYDVSKIYPKLVENALSLAPDWSAAYALYTLGEAPFVLTYSSSPAYHQIVEGDFTQKTALDKDNSYLHIEFLAITKRCEREKLAKSFLDYMISQDIQKTLPEKVWVFPARQDIPLPTVFQEIEKPQKLLCHSPEEVQELKEKWYQCKWF